jgi:hypothetical protein
MSLFLLCPPVYSGCFQSQGCDVVYVKRDLYQRLWMKKRDLKQRLWMNKKRPIPEVVDE